MASSSSLLSEEQFLCPICLDVFTRPVSTPCGHNFCMSCITSYWDNASFSQCPVCKEQFQRRPDLKVNTFISELASQLVSLQTSYCDHSRVLVLFCRDDNTLLCDVCSSSCHARHNVVPVQRAYERMKDELENTEAKVQQMIQERFHKVQSMTESVKQTAERQADGFVSDMQREIKELQRTAVKLRELKQTTDQLRFLQSYSSTSLLPHTMDLSTVSANKHLEMQHFGKSLRKSASQLRVSLDEMNTEISRFSGGTAESDAATLRYMQQYEVNIVLDPDSAHPMLCLSNDGKQVRYNMGAGMWAGQFLNPNMFTSHLAVLGRRGFSSGRFYFEVCTGQKTEWCVGVATASIQRRGPLVRSSCCGLWAIWFLIDKFETFICPGVPVHMGKVGRVGVFVDYDKGEISFYDVENATPIYSFTECSFTEELFPYFNPCDNEFGSNLEPLTIVPVCHVE
uniref:E3 ubiquitin-protein ligase TRIM21-like n=1 Tax=Acanthochromis polyacanthus TaxID=80966 RepID=A0A3Q1GVK4_9TELE